MSIFAATDTTYTTADLEDAVTRLREARADYEALAGEWSAICQQNRDLLDTKAAAARVQVEAERQVKEVSLALWAAGDRQSMTMRPGIEVVVINDVDVTIAEELP